MSSLHSPITTFLQCNDYQTLWHPLQFKKQCPTICVVMRQVGSKNKWVWHVPHRPCCGYIHHCFPHYNLIVQWTLTNPNSLGPELVWISESFGLVKFQISEWTAAWFPFNAHQNSSLSGHSDLLRVRITGIKWIFHCSKVPVSHTQEDHGLFFYHADRKQTTNFLVTANGKYKAKETNLVLNSFIRRVH